MKDHPAIYFAFIMIGIIIGLIISIFNPCPVCPEPVEPICPTMERTSCPPIQYSCDLETAQKICDRAMDYAESTERRYELK